jgi:hypothetical protein
MPDLDQIKGETGDGRGRLSKVRSAIPLAGRTAAATTSTALATSEVAGCGLLQIRCK